MAETSGDKWEHMQRFGHVLPAETAMAPSVSALQKWVAARASLLINLIDGRILSGKLICVDHKGNIILSDCSEMRPAPDSSPCLPISTRPPEQAPPPIEASVKGAPPEPKQRTKKKQMQKRGVQSAQVSPSHPPLDEFEDEPLRMELAARVSEEAKYERYMVRYDAPNRLEVRYQGLVLISARHYSSMELDVASIPPSLNPNTFAKPAM